LVDNTSIYTDLRSPTGVDQSFTGKVDR